MAPTPEQQISFLVNLQRLLDEGLFAEERRYAETLYPMAQEAMRDGIYFPRRSNPVCSRRYCGYWRECEREFGGQVEE